MSAGFERLDRLINNNKNVYSHIKGFFFSLNVYFKCIKGSRIARFEANLVFMPFRGGF